MSGRKSGGRPTREQAAVLDGRLLDGARAAFCRKGIASSSLEEIAAQLGISKHTIYRRYPNKAALLEAVLERDILDFRHALAAAVGEATGPLDAVRHVALRYCVLGSARDYAAFYLSVNAEAALSGALRERLATWSEAALEPLTEAIIAAQAAGLIRSGDPSTIRDILVDLLEGVNNRVRLGNTDGTGLQVIEPLFKARWAVFASAMLRVPPPQALPE
ncbi:TetR/AcrR family transcriptional regulator [Aquabacter sp. CN5-332]|uniref:TetR/AcrR family transcriptional regulator n=1 Tax=Aquabacter sp. CN5-332 TaxID=3156608 RepID=UPI0032B3E66F